MTLKEDRDSGYKHDKDAIIIFFLAGILILMTIASFVMITVHLIRS